MKKHPQTVRKEKYIELIENYKKEGLSRNQILKLLNWTGRQLICFLYAYNISLTRRNNEIINKDQEQVILGSLLGDGCISYSGKFSKSARLALHHSIKQLDYLKYKYSIIENLCSTGIRTKLRIDKRKKWKNSIMCNCKTRSLEIFTEYRKRWYKDKKTVNKEDVYKIEPLGLAIWYMDDGCTHCFKNLTRSMCIFSQGFSREDNIILQNMLKEKFNINTVLRKANYLYIRTNSQQDFINLIKHYIIDSMQYKIAPVKSGEFRETPEVDNPEPSSLNSVKVNEKVQRLTSEELTNNLDTSAGQFI
jgi:hypothetical protein